MVAVSVWLPTPRRAHSVGRGTVYSQVLQANALYIQGMDYLSKSNRRNGGSLANARQAVRLFQSGREKILNSRSRES